jgi:F-type H+-transporting ATPase subunit alpha
MKSVAGGLRLDLAAFRELEAFAQLGTDLDKATQSQLDRGYRMVEILKQGAFQPMPVVDQIMIIYAGTKGYLDKVDRRQVPTWEAQFHRFMKEQRPAVRNLLLKERKMTPEVERQLKEAIEAFGHQFHVEPARPRTSEAIKPAQHGVTPAQTGVKH